MKNQTIQTSYHIKFIHGLNVALAMAALVSSHLSFALTSVSTAITAESSGKCIQVPSNSTDAVMIQETCSSSVATQNFTIRQASDGSGAFAIEANNSPYLCLDSGSGLSTNQTPVVQNTCNGVNSQDWYPQINLDGSYNFYTHDKTGCIEVFENSDDNGAWLVTGSCTTATNQKFKLQSLIPAPTPTVTPTSTATPTPIIGATYYIAPANLGGSDLNNGLSASKPWLTPKHTVNCGDQILALPSTAYSNLNFNAGMWGTVNCTTNNNVAWVKCESFDQCKMTASAGTPGFYIDRNYWGVQGFEVNANAKGAGACFNAGPSASNPNTIHHIIFSNDIANGCQEGGFASFNQGVKSVDYIAIIGNIAYNAAQGTDQCYSGISIYEPVQFDSATGTHIYVEGNLSYHNVAGNGCAGGGQAGGGGLIFDTFDGSQEGTPTYTAQAVAENNILVDNGSSGLSVQNNATNNLGNKLHALIFFIGNTVTNNNTDIGNGTTTNNPYAGTFCNEANINVGFNISVRTNLIVSAEEKACIGNYKYAFGVYQGDSTDSVTSNVLFAPLSWEAGSFYADSSIPSGSVGTFSYGNNLSTVAPNFKNPTIALTAPNCSAYSSASACIVPISTAFTPQATQDVGYGYKTPSTTYAADSYFPAWLCNTKLPTGLVTNHCN